MHKEKEFSNFIEKCTGLSKKEVKERMGKMQQYKSFDWLQVSKFCGDMRSVASFKLKLYNLQIEAMKRAVETATSFDDWFHIAQYALAGMTSWDNLEKSCREIRKLDLTNDEIDLLRTMIKSRYVGNVWAHFENKRRGQGK